MKIKQKEINLKLNCFSGKSQPEKGYFEGGVCDPRFVDELPIWVQEGEKYDEKKMTIDNRMSIKIRLRFESTFSELNRLCRNLCSRLHVGGDTANMAVATSFKPYGIPSKNTISYTIKLNFVKQMEHSNDKE